MNIRKSAGALLIPLALGTAGLGAIDCHAASTKPNFINIILDDLGFSDLGAFGSEIPTPHLDQLANDGIIMTNFYAAPTSTPGRGMLFAGKSSHASGVGIMASMAPEGEQIDKPEYEGRLSLNALPFPELLQQNGYYTMFTGKWDLSEISTVPLTNNPPEEFSDGADLAAQTAYLADYETYLTKYAEYFTEHQPQVVAPKLPKEPTEAGLQAQYDNLLSTYNTLEEEYSAIAVPDMAAHDPYSRGFSVTKAALILGGANNYSTATAPYIPWELFTKAVTNSDWLYTENGEGIPNFPEEFYSTNYYTKSAKEMLSDWSQNESSQPFYLCVSYTAPHNPLQAPADVTAKYIDTYSRGWEDIRKERFKKQLELGFWPGKDLTDLPPIPGRTWASVPEGTDVLIKRPDGASPENYRPDEATPGNTYGGKQYSAKEMAVYAAMIEILDLRIGELIDHLKEIGAYENTLIMIHGDNGAASQVYGNVDSAKKSYDDIGNRDSYTSLDAEWAITSNTPFSNMKVSQHEGGWHTAAIIHYPKWKKAKGMKADMVSSVTDFAPMMLDMAGISYPTTYNGKENAPMFGIPALRETHPAVVPLNKQLFVIGSNGVKENTADRYVAFEMLGAIGLRSGDWKLVKERCDYAPELFNLAEDPFETIDLSDAHPDKMEEMKGLYYKYAQENNIIQRNIHLFGFECEPL